MLIPGLSWGREGGGCTRGRGGEEGERREVKRAANEVWLLSLSTLLPAAQVLLGHGPPPESLTTAALAMMLTIINLHAVNETIIFISVDIDDADEVHANSSSCCLQAACVQRRICEKPQSAGSSAASSRETPPESS
ncbi:unnamed protein product [Pleuronectes platessa]|uniref:Uncharacterized protein n=1 Tax=Pleuronectes platessa TaxID=8262 RepID=A0A9N7YED2_PLEPL|nr:unnamed protein product [Pleuronectes platessa]